MAACSSSFGISSFACFGGPMSQGGFEGIEEASSLDYMVTTS